MDIDLSSVEEALAAAPGVPGVSVAWRDDNGELGTATFGDVTPGGRELSPETLFQAGSVSKPVTAVAILRLVDQGVVDLDADINDVLKSWRVPPVDDWQPRLTLRRLLTHTAGTTVHGFPGYAHDAEVPSVPALLDGEPPANTPAVRVVLMPGLIWKYSGGGTTIAQQAIVDATGTSFPDLLRELVLEPCDMGRATFEQPLPERLHEYAATGHLADGDPVDGRWHTYPEMAAAGLWCAPKDLVSFAGSVQAAVAGKPGAILPVELARLLVTPDSAASRRMGIGFFLSGGSEEDAPAERFGHGGGDHGFLTDLSAEINGLGAAAAMVHSLAGGPVARAGTRAVGQTLGWAEADPGPLDQAGLMAALANYSTDDGRIFELALTEGRVTLTAPGQPPLPLEMVSILSWTSKLGLTVALEVEDGSAEAIAIHQAGTTIRAHRAA